MKASVTELRRRLPGRRSRRSASASAAGWCGRSSPSKEPRLAAAAPFYGPFPEGSSLNGSKAAVLGIYGALDSRVNATGRPRAALARSRPSAPAGRLPERRPRLLQRHRWPVQPRRRPGGLQAGPAWFKRYVGEMIDRQFNAASDGGLHAAHWCMPSATTAITDQPSRTQNQRCRLKYASSATTRPPRTRARRRGTAPSRRCAGRGSRSSGRRSRSAS